MPLLLLALLVLLPSLLPLLLSPLLALLLLLLLLLLPWRLHLAFATRLRGCTLKCPVQQNSFK